MAKKTRTIHLICNAHLDPVWLWEWQEGAAEAISTFRTAAELCEQNEAFIFNHNEVTLYQWVQEYEPALFERIRKLVKKGRWHIMGGWYLQPDCNMPSGESFVRQMLLGKEYFKEQFGVDVTTAINFDPFGHTQGLVQIMAKSGYDSYIFGRPQTQWLDLPADDFMWVGYDGSEIMATRFAGWYNTELGRAATMISERIDANADREPLAILWGVGNHGGGPSHKDIKDVTKLIASRKDVEICHSTPEVYFKHLAKAKKADLPRVDKDLNLWAPGCYTSQIRIKQKHRLLENELYSLEKMASAAELNGLMKYPKQEIGEAMHDLMVGEFHDILPGSSIQPVEESAIRMMDHGLEIAGRLKARAFFALASGQKKAKTGTIPILVYNPHPFKARCTVECEFNLHDFLWKGWMQVYVNHKGKQIPAQVEQELSRMFMDWRKRVVFEADLEPNQMNRFDCTFEFLETKPAIKTRPKGNVIRLKNDKLDVIINTRTGLIDKYKVDGIDLMKRGAFKPVVIQDDPDPWGMMVSKFAKVIGSFKTMTKAQAAEFAGVKSKTLDPVRIIEDGANRTVVESLMAYNNSFLRLVYKIPKNGTEMEIELDVLWNEKDKMLKLEVPTGLQDSKYIGQVAYGRSELPNNGNEAVAQKWVAVVDESRDIALTSINDCIYGSDCMDGRLRLTLLRSPGYSAHPNEEGVCMPQDRFSPRVDQGLRSYRFWFNAGKASQLLSTIDREALVRNEKPFALSFFPHGGGKTPNKLAVLSDRSVLMTAFKQSQSNQDYIIRLFEPTGKARTTTLSLPAIKKKLSVKLAPFEIKSLRINARSGSVVETDLLEKKISVKGKKS